MFDTTAKKLGALAGVGVLIAAGAYFLMRDGASDGNPSGPAPQGDETSVPNLEGTATFDATFGERGTALGVTIQPLAIVEDSRCALDVVCIQAGTVGVRIRISSDRGTEEQTIQLGTPLVGEVGIIELLSVSPSPASGLRIPASSYRFTFRVTRSNESFESKG